jgi:hypothetical protein
MLPGIGVVGESALNTIGGRKKLVQDVRGVIVGWIRQRSAWIDQLRTGERLPRKRPISTVRLLPPPLGGVCGVWAVVVSVAFICRRSTEADMIGEAVIVAIITGVFGVIIAIIQTQKQIAKLSTTSHEQQKTDPLRSADTPGQLTEAQQHDVKAIKRRSSRVLWLTLVLLVLSFAAGTIVGSNGWLGSRILVFKQPRGPGQWEVADFIAWEGQESLNVKQLPPKGWNLAVRRPKEADWKILDQTGQWTKAKLDWNTVPDQLEVKLGIDPSVKRSDLRLPSEVIKVSR